MNLSGAVFSLLAVSAALAFLSAWGLTALARRAALRWRVMSEVTGRSSHAAPTPRLGGVGLGLGFVIGVAALLTGLRFVTGAGWEIGLRTPLLLWVLAGWSLMFLVGLLDDLLDLPALVKLSLEALAALAPAVGAGVGGGLLAEALGASALPPFATAALGRMLAFGWILFFTNGYNFMDGMDGFAARFAQMAAFGFFAAVLWGGGAPQIEILALIPFLAACGGFLMLNRPPARIFMGDAGSLSTGYLLAVIPLLGRPGMADAPYAISPLTALTILMPFVFDVVLTLLRRARMGHNLLQAHREHLYQRLMRRGLSHAQVLKTNDVRFLVCVLMALGGVLLADVLWRWAMLAASAGVMVQYWIFVLRTEREAAK